MRVHATAARPSRLDKSAQFLSPHGCGRRLTTRLRGGRRTGPPLSSPGTLPHSAPPAPRGVRVCGVDLVRAKVPAGRVAGASRHSNSAGLRAVTQTRDPGGPVPPPATAALPGPPGAAPQCDIYRIFTFIAYLGGLASPEVASLHCRAESTIICCTSAFVHCCAGRLST
jgi:hypothetical protein